GALEAPADAAGSGVGDQGSHSPDHAGGALGAPADAAGSGVGGAEDFANRVRKNLKKLKKWVEKENITCYRIYDADLPDYALAVDLYEGFVHVREHERPETVDPLKAEKRLHGAIAALREILGVGAEQVFVKHRRRARGGTQYGKLGETREMRTVREGGLKFLVNPGDYFDTGLFLDHRPTRELLRSLARGVKFLNLFAYTGTASVYAAAGGAATTTTVDLSSTYLDWARRNMELNRYSGPRHRFVEADVLAWLRKERTKYGLIFLDPPTFSTSKSMAGTLDIQRDHVHLVRSAASLLDRGGVLVFSNNFKKFKMDVEALAPLQVEDVTTRTIPPDFARNLRVHHTFLIRES
ncbi:MAG: bifunctional 23S rRNA (guanine(2069)-N(7))-methyltransferase RlmK/23S rRNA (guanine(2445)-N(2))-methyltransferase RlmL, partial [Deltaproteobacteria bacterium]|nr:bifunctional 23S rRNA (guanine(2069)-N(7))-methyltransferase RlmK/23S rRNA (guanine(2445)-N(2))-methyltransferase RlmL [Deltaproteobacteria bacterium]